LSYEDIKSDISMDKASFYRNITKFEEQGILNSFESNDKKRYFDKIR
jgi:Fur family ferric uptake transcriptional regulator